MGWPSRVEVSVEQQGDEFAVGVGHVGQGSGPHRSAELALEVFQAGVSVLP
jgi:hypothetical protein